MVKCNPCYADLFATKCRSCEKTIMVEEDARLRVGEPYHKECLVRLTCGIGWVVSSSSPMKVKIWFAKLDSIYFSKLRTKEKDPLINFDEYARYFTEILDVTEAMKKTLLVDPLQKVKMPTITITSFSIIRKQTSPRIRSNLWFWSCELYHSFHKKRRTFVVPLADAECFRQRKREIFIKPFSKNGKVLGRKIRKNFAMLPCSFHFIFWKHKHQKNSWPSIIRHSNVRNFCQQVFAWGEQLPLILRQPQKNDRTFDVCWK